MGRVVGEFEKGGGDRKKCVKTERQKMVKKRNMRRRYLQKAGRLGENLNEGRRSGLAGQKLILGREGKHQNSPGFIVLEKICLGVPNPQTSSSSEYSDNNFWGGQDGGFQEVLCT